MRRRVRRPRPRGAAAVELAIMCVVLVPLMMYMSFLEDALQYKLDGQEAVISAPYDFEIANYEKSVNADSVGHYNRLTHCDHTSAYNTYGDREYDCGEGRSSVHHHGAWSAHQCWLVSGAEQVKCSWKKGLTDNVPATSPFSVYAWAPRWNQGGIAECNGKLGIMNYYLPNQFFGFWSKVSVTSGKRDTGASDQAVGGTGGRLEKFSNDNVHLDAPHANGGNALLLPKEQFAMLYDPWGLNRTKKVGPNDFAPVTSITVDSPIAVPGSAAASYHSLLDRAGHYYTYWGNTLISSGRENYIGKTMDFFKAAKDKDLLRDYAAWDGIGDHPRSLPIYFNPDDKTRAHASGYASGWQDSRQSQMEGSRQKFYFGMDSNWW